MRNLVLIACFLLFMGCHSDERFQQEVPVTVLVEFETVVALEDETLSNPLIVRYDGFSSLFVYDAGYYRILELDSLGNVVNEFGTRGRGPGEFQWVSNLFIGGDHIYLMDYALYLIHKFHRNGDFITSIDPGVRRAFMIPPLPPLPSEILSTLDMGFHSRVNNQPHVMLDGGLLIPSSSMNEALYEFKDGAGSIISKIGTVPDGSSFEIDFAAYRNSIMNNEIPAVLMSNSFLVNDPGNKEEVFIVYNAIPTIAKYDTSGRRLWHVSDIATPETDGISRSYFEGMRDVLRIADGMTTHRVYLGGVSSPESELYVSAYSYATKELWIHAFSAGGELQNRYQFISDTILLPIFDIDFKGRRMFVLTEDAEIRVYPF